MRVRSHRPARLTGYVSCGSVERLEDRALLTGVAGWEQNLGGSRAWGTAVDDAGNAYVAGSLDVNSDGAGELLAKYAADGTRLWALAYSGFWSNTTSRVTTDEAGNVYLAGRFSGTLTVGGKSATAAGSFDAAVAKIASDGTVLWLQSFGGTADDAARAIVSDGESVFVTGYFEGATAVGTSVSGTRDGYAAKLDADDGSLVASFAFGGAGGTQVDMGDSIALDGAGGVYVGGRFEGTSAFGSQTVTSVGGSDAAVFRLDGSLGLAWLRQMGGDSAFAGAEAAWGLAVAPPADDGEPGRVYVTGGLDGNGQFGSQPTGSSGGFDAFLTCLDADGQFLWTKTWGGASGDLGRGLDVSDAGEVYVVGGFEGTADFDPGVGSLTLTAAGGSRDGFILKLDADGNYQAVWQIAGSGSWAEANGVAVDGGGSVYAVGYVNGPTAFPSGGSFSTVDDDVFLMRLDPNARTIRGAVYNDADGNGARGAEAGIAGRTVFIDADGDGVFDAGEASAVTDAAGSYRLIVAGAGDYLVRQVSPAGWSATGEGAAGYHVSVGANDPAGSYEFGSRTALATKFLVIDDSSADLVFRYTSGGGNIYSTAVAVAPRDVTSNAAGTRSWVLSAGGLITVYNEAGAAIGSWQATGLSNPQGIATNGTDLWVVDATTKRVYRFAGGAARLSGSAAAMSNFTLNNKNTNATGVTTDGTSLWVVDDGASSDKVYKYTASNGKLAGSWTVNYGGGVTNASPTGISVDYAANGSVTSTLWLLDNASDRTYRFDAATGLTNGSKTANGSLQLAAGNLQGLADPPAGGDTSAALTPAKKGGSAATRPSFAPGPSVRVELILSGAAVGERRDDGLGPAEPVLAPAADGYLLSSVLGDVLDELLAA